MKRNNDLTTLGVMGISAALTITYMLNRRKQYSVEGKVVLITGGSRGLGLVLARQLAAEGAKLTICARDKSELEKAMTDLNEISENILAIQCDVTDKELVDLMMSEIKKYWGQSVDVLINNAGVNIIGPFENMTLDDFDEAMKVHFWAPLYTTQAVLNDMKDKKEGRIVNISSIGGLISPPHLLPYSSSKFALTGLSHGLRAELKKYNILVTTVNPGFMRTGSHRNIMVKGQHSKEYATFSILSVFPLLAISAKRAAKKIIKAFKAGQATTVISLPAKIIAAFYANFTGLSLNLFAFFDRLLPKPTPSFSRRKGYESFSKFSPSILTVLGEKAAAENNEIAVAQT